MFFSPITAVWPIHNRNCHAKGIAWHMPEPYELYTPEAMGRIDRILAGVEEIRPLLSERERLRVENQISLWNKAKDIVRQSLQDAQIHSESEEPIEHDNTDI